MSGSEAVSGSAPISEPLHPFGTTPASRTSIMDSSRMTGADPSSETAPRSGSTSILDSARAPSTASAILNPPCLVLLVPLILPQLDLLRKLAPLVHLALPVHLELSLYSVRHPHLGLHLHLEVLFRSGPTIHSAIHPITASNSLGAASITIHVHFKVLLNNDITRGINVANGGRASGASRTNTIPGNLTPLETV